MRVVFMGSPDFALPTLRALLEAGHQLALVVSQPDREAGRGRTPTPPPVARFAREHGLPLYQTATLKTEPARAPIVAAQPDVIVVASFGLLLPRSILELPPLGCLNVHPSLLPRHRGASPIPATLLAGDHETGVTIMLMDAGLDSGPILAQRTLPVRPEDDALSLEASLALLGAALLVETLPRWAAGAITPQPRRCSPARCARTGSGRWRTPRCAAACSRSCGRSR
jgi:methionyl-tRNA formyltransferase